MYHDYVKGTLINYYTLVALNWFIDHVREAQSLHFAFLDHYNKVAESYDDYLSEIEEAQIESVVEYLDLQPDHVVIDVGAGTGQSAEKIFKIAGLKNPIICVDPSAEMLEKASGRKGVVGVLKTAEEFFDDVSLCPTLDRVLFKGCIHHLLKPLSAFKNMERSLRPNGLCLIVFMRSISCYKRFSEAIGIDAEYLPPEEVHAICKMLEEANFDVSTSLVELPFNLKKAKFYKMLRGRFMSSLFSLTDEQIEKGIDVLEQGEFGQIEGNEEIESILKNVVIKATKSKINFEWSLKLAGQNI